MRYFLPRCSTRIEAWGMSWRVRAQPDDLRAFATGRARSDDIRETALHATEVPYANHTEEESAGK